VPPVLAVEVAGAAQGDTEELLREKASWYLGVGVEAVWILLPESREAIVLSPGKESRVSGDDRLPEPPGLSGLRPMARELFSQIGSRA